MSISLFVFQTKTTNLSQFTIEQRSFADMSYKGQLQEYPACPGAGVSSGQGASQAEHQPKVGKANKFFNYHELNCKISAGDTHS